MEKVKLMPTEWAQRRLSGLPLEGFEMISEKILPRDKVLLETRRRLLAGIDPVGSKRLLDEMAVNPGSYPGSFEWRKAQILEKAKSQGVLQNVGGEDMEIVATYEDRAIAWDFRGDRYFQIDYEMSDNNEITVTNVKEMETQLVIKEQEEVVRDFFRSLLLEGDSRKAKSIVKIAQHLVEFGTAEAEPQL